MVRTPHRVRCPRELSPSMSATSCPYCKGSISADLIRFGGTCPHCMLEVHGEEAATDPGAELRKKQEAEQQQQQAVARKKSRNTSLAVVLLLVAGIGGVGYAWYKKQNETAAVLNFEEYYQVDLESLPGAQVPDPTAQAAVGGPVPTGKQGGARPSQSRTPAGPSRPGILSSDEPIVTGTTVAAADTTSAVGGLKRASSADALPADAMPLPTMGTVTTSSGTPKIGSGSAVTVSRPGMDEVLTDEQAIYEMTKRLLTAYSPQLQGCYNNRLKQNENLKGVWKVEFVIAKDGTTKGVSVSALNTADAELESCMTRNVSGWRFQRVAKDQPVAKTYRFGASGF